MGRLQESGASNGREEARRMHVNMVYLTHSDTHYTPQVAMQDNIIRVRA